MRIPEKECIQSQIGSTNDPLILANMVENSRECKAGMKFIRWSLVLSLLFLAGLVAFAAWCVVTA